MTPVLPNPTSTGLWSVAGEHPSFPRRSELRPRFRGDRRVDLAVVGAGLTGLSTALHFTQCAPGTKVVVLEAQEIAGGASGRGTGLLGPRIGPDVVVARKRFGDRVARAMFDASTDAVGDVVRIIAQHRIACDLHTGPQLVVARTPRQVAQLRAQARAYRELGVSVTVLERDELAARLPFPYLAALRYDAAATFEPPRLAFGLAQCAEARGVEIYEHSPVLEVSHGPELRLFGGRLSAGAVVIATNAFHLQTKGVVPAGIIAVETQASVTEPLPSPTLQALAPLARTPIIEWGGAAPYFRLTADGRLILGGGAHVLPRRPAELARVRERTWRAQRSWLRALHPALRTQEVARRWSGYVAATADELPVVGRRPRLEGVWYAGGWCGHGLALSVATGRQLAASLLDGSPADTRALPWWRSDAPALSAASPLRPAFALYLDWLTYHRREPLRELEVGTQLKTD